ncbi:hypothetical protein Tco_1056275 [Tanacetum coccineum]|uniref:Gag protein n=1 Tax=Tanacetum coccineum TaxID=301880 RepID=A0ABQ5H210_9ASTR
MTTLTITTSNSQMHINIMATGSRERPPMLATRRYTQWQSLKPTTTKEAIPEHNVLETYKNTTPKKRAYFDVEAEAIHMILSGIRDDIYSTVDACTITKEMWIAIERLQQDELLNKQDVKTNLLWEFGKFTSRDGESIESYYLRFYKMINEMIRKKLEVATMQVNVQFLQQFQPKWSRFYHNEVNDIRAEKLSRNANPLALVVATQQYPDTHYQAPKPHKNYASSSKPTPSTRSHAPTRNRGKETVKPITPLSESASKEDKDNDPEQAQRDKDM